MKPKKANRIQLALIAVVILAAAALFLLSGVKRDIGTCREYKLDVKALSLSTQITVYQDEESLYTISGNLFRIIEDPLTMYDMTGNKIAYAGDAYHFIAQDSHGIRYGTDTKIDMVGEVNLLGQSYSIYDSDGKRLASVKVDPLNLRGKMVDTDGNLLADYTSRFLMYDFDVRIKEECALEDEIVLMIFSAYFSDYKYDSQQSSK